MKIITGYTGEPHVTSHQDRMLNQGIFGSGMVVLSTGKQMAAEIVTNNEIRIRDGIAVMQGCVFCVETNTYDAVAINNGTQSMNRIDLIVARYTRNPETQVEDIQEVVIQGTPAAGAAAVPACTKGDIQQGDTQVDMPLYEVHLSGIAVTQVKKVFEDFTDVEKLMEYIAEKAPKVHNHPISQITDIADANVAGAKKADAVPWSGVSGKPSTFPPSGHTHDDRYYTETETKSLVNARLESSRVVAHSWIAKVSGTYLDVNFSQIPGMVSGQNYVIFVNNANRSASNITVGGASLDKQPPTAFRIYWDDPFEGNVQFVLIAIKL